MLTKVVQILGKMRTQYSYTMPRKHPPPILGFVAIAIALPPPTITELLIDSDMFITRLSPELNVTYVEPRYVIDSDMFITRLSPELNVTYVEPKIV